MQDIIREARQKRGMKVIVGPKGKYRNLCESFIRVNERYFKGELQTPRLSWSKRRTYRRFGHHDEALDTIVISRTLDDKNVPLFLLDFVIFHEALHIKHGTTYIGGRRRVHTKTFREEEKRFSEYEKARRMLMKLVGNG
jgi:hypothetical protein